jgi:hypothetical protein
MRTVGGVGGDGMKGSIERQIWYSGCPDDEDANADGGKKDEERMERSRALRLQSERQSDQVSECDIWRNVIIIHDVKVRAGLHLVKSEHEFRYAWPHGHPS